MIRGSIGGIALALAAPAFGQSAGPAPGYTMPFTQSWDMTSDEGATYRIFLSYPEEKPPAEGWPVLYVLDGNAMFAGFAETRRIQEFYAPGKGIVVGVGYPTDKPYDPRRAADFTTIRLTTWAAPARTSRDKFLDFLTGKLRTEVAARHKVNPARQSLFGHSLGGIFALHVLYARPDAFHAIVAASPSMWWDNQAMLREERDFAERLTSGKVAKASRLLIVAGEREEASVMVGDTQALARRLEPLSAYGLRTQSRIYAGEGHMTVPARAITDTLRFVASWP